MSRVVAGASTASGRAAQGPAQEPFFDWTRPHFPAAEHAARRQRLIGLLAADGGVFVAASGEGISSGETFRVAEDFLYFAGLELPNSVLMVDAGDGEATLFVPARDPRFDNPSRRNDFPGRALLDDPRIRSETGIARLRPIEELAAAIGAVAAAGRPVYANFGAAGATTDPAPAADPFVVPSPEGAFAGYLTELLPAGTVYNAYGLVARLRMVKSALEIEAMRRTAAITMAGIRHAATFIRDGVDERRLEGELEAEFKRRGAQRLPFASIIKSGPNSLWPWRVLASHYDRRNRAMHDGELVIFDVGAELDYFVSDVGRTFPVSGRFTDEQRRILEMEVGVADAIIAAIRPGVTLRDLQAIGVAAIPQDERRYMQAGLFFGHHLGLSTGDPNLPEAALQPGMIFTVEPWYYNHDLGIAVFTEDEILVTASGAENLTADLPRRPAELEALTGR